MSQSFGLHSTEVAGAQTAPELAYDFLSRDDEETQRILDNTILLLFPNFNPDGQIMVTDWYYKNKGTEFEGVGLPWLYHKYVGHDNNRDADYLNMARRRCRPLSRPRSHFVAGSERFREPGRRFGAASNTRARYGQSAARARS